LQATNAGVQLHSHILQILRLSFLGQIFWTPSTIPGFFPFLFNTAIFQKLVLYFLFKVKENSPES